MKKHHPMAGGQQRKSDANHRVESRTYTKTINEMIKLVELLLFED